MTSSFLLFKTKLGFVSFAVLATLFASSMVEAKKTEDPLIKHKISKHGALSPKKVHFLGVQKVDGICYVVLADLMLKQLYIENVQSYSKGLVEFLKRSDDLFKDEKNHEIPYNTTRKQFKEERLKAFEEEKFKLPPHVTSANDEEAFQIIIQN